MSPISAHSGSKSGSSSAFNLICFASPISKASAGQRGLAGHEFAKVRHYEPTQNRLVRPEQNGFGRGNRCFHYVIERAKKSVSRQNSTSTVFIELQGFANAIDTANE